MSPAPQKSPLPPKSAPSSRPECNEAAEPGAGQAPVPRWAVLLWVGLLCWGAFYTFKHGGGFSARVYQPYQSEAQLQALQPKPTGDDLLARGRQVYRMYCAVCHQASGAGVPGQFPPLAGSEWVLAPSPEAIIRLVLNGGQGSMEVKGQVYQTAVMPPWQDLLKDADLAAVLTYVRQNPEWDHQASAVKPDQVRAIREQVRDRTSPWAAEELKAFLHSQ